MGIFSKLAQLIFAPLDENGNPRSVSNQDMQVWGTEVERVTSLFISSGGLIYSSRPALEADLAHGANSMAWVIGDPVAANNGIYGKVGASGAGSWTKRGDLPFSFIIATDAGAGTANAIQATTSTPVSESALIWMNIFEVNTASPVTVSFNGGSALTIKTNSGNNIAAGGLTAGMIVIGIVSGTTFRLLSDQASAAIVAAAEAAQAAAEAAAASINDRTFTTFADAAAATIPAIAKRIRTQFYAPVYAEPATLKGGAHYRRVHKDDTTSYPSRSWFRSADRFLPDGTTDSTNGGYWLLDEVVPNVCQFGTVGDGTTDDTAALQAARDYLAVQSGLEVDLQKMSFPAGTYAYTASPNWALSYVEIVADGKVILKHTGSGQAVIIDSGAYPASGVVDMKMWGFIVEGNVNTTIGLYTRALHHSNFKFNIRCGTTFAHYNEFGVCSHFDLIISNNHGPWTGVAYPPTGIFLNKRDTNEETSYCTFKVIVEGCGIGLEASWALGCLFIGDTIEGNHEKGVHIYPNSRRLKFFAVDFEFNDRTDESTVAAGDDIVCQGFQNDFIHCDGDGKITLSSGSEENTVDRGAFNEIGVESGALRNELDGVGYNRFGDGALTVSDASTILKGLRNVTDNYSHDAIPANTALTVGASPWTYTNSTGNACTISLSGGTISYFGFRANLPSGAAEFGVSYIPGLFRLEPGQGFQIIYSSVPTITRHDH